MDDEQMRDHYVETYEQLSLGFARTLITLAGGALGLSLTFAKEIIGSSGAQWREWLIAAWVLWTISLIAVLSGYLFGREAARIAITQSDEGKLKGDNKEKPGRSWSPATHAAAWIGLIALVLGVVAFVAYVIKTLE